MTHRMTPLPASYDAEATEKKWQRTWREHGVYAWVDDDRPENARANSFVIDTPPPTVSGTLHMGHVFSYTQADFIARYQRMTGKNVFYPMGFDDNGLPTERLVEKTIKKRAVDMSREDFIAECMKVSEEARNEFRNLFESIALSVDWKQEYHTISESSRRLSQLSFLDMVNKNECYRAMRPFYWDPVDQTAIASAEIEDKDLPSFANDIVFKVACHPEHRAGSRSSEILRDAQDDMSAQTLTIMTTRPELLPACVALFCHPEDTRYTHLHGKQAEVPLFGFTVPILTDDMVEMEKGTGLMMCCTFGDDADIAKWQKHQLPARVIINKFGKMDLSALERCHGDNSPLAGESKFPDSISSPTQADKKGISVGGGEAVRDLSDAPLPSPPRKGEGTTEQAARLYQALHGKKISSTDPKHPGARQIIIEMLKEANLLVSQKPITHAVKCAERSGAPLEILPTHQWFVKVTDKKEALKQKAARSVWNPDWMRLRIEQWIDGLNQDWCISRQRYFGVPFPVWYVQESGIGDQGSEMLVARAEDLPVNPLVDVPYGYEKLEALDGLSYRARRLSDGAEVIITPDADVMDTWATSSISPQLSAGAIHGDHSPLAGESKFLSSGSQYAMADEKGISVGGGDVVRDLSGAPLPSPPRKVEGTTEPASPPAHHSRFAKLFPADLRPQAHEIIRTWAFYTIVKAHIHNDSVPWHNLMISGWCLAEDKSKMSKSKGNVITPVALIEEKGADAVRYWAATSRLGQDTAFSPDLLKIGKKLVNKLWNATAFAAIHLEHMAAPPATAAEDCAVVPPPLGGRLGGGLPQSDASASSAPHLTSPREGEESQARGASRAEPIITEILDQWILSRLGETVAKATEAYEKYEYAEALDATNQFFWADFCDNYLELIKKRIYNEDGSFSTAARQSAIRAVYYCLEGILKLYAPVIPHVTEELYSHIFADAYAKYGSLHARAMWPRVEDYPHNAEALEMGRQAVQVLTHIRGAKSVQNRSIKFPVALLTLSASYTNPGRWMPDVMGAGNVREWKISSDGIDIGVALADEMDTV